MSKKTAKPKPPVLYSGGPVAPAPAAMAAGRGRPKLPGVRMGFSGGPVSAASGSRPKLPGTPMGFSGGPVRAKPAPKARKVKKARGLALGEAVACCAAEALAASLRLTGWPVSDRDVLALYELTAGGPDAGASILATLEAAAEHGLAGMRPLDFREVMSHVPEQCWRGADCDAGLQEMRAGLILGADLPGPHALCDDGTAWWSWGQPYDPASFPDAVIEEAWALDWEPS